jgi:dGTPase
LDIQVKSDRDIFHWIGINTKGQLSKKEWQDLIDFEGNANGFSVLTGSRPGIEGGLRISYATLGALWSIEESLPKNQQA